MKKKNITFIDIWAAYLNKYKEIMNLPDNKKWAEELKTELNKKLKEFDELEFRKYYEK